MCIAPTNVTMSYHDGWDKKCPRCIQHDETIHHILHCNEAGRVDALMCGADALGKWLDYVDTDSRIVNIILQYVEGQWS